MLCVCVTEDARRRALSPLELDLKVVIGQPAWKLGTELDPPQEQLSCLSSPQIHSFVYR